MHRRRDRGALRAPLKRAGRDDAPPSITERAAARENFEEFIYRVWGAGIAKHFAIPYNRKLWAVPLTEMETSWLGGRVPLPDLEQMIDGALEPTPQADGAERALRLSAARRLPGADGRLPAASDAATCALNANVRQRVAEAAHGRRCRDGRTRSRYEHADQHDAAAGAGALHAATRRRRTCARRRAALRHVSVRCVNLGVGARERHRQALDLLPGRHRLPPHLRAGQRQPALQSAGRLRPHLRDHLLADSKPLPVRRRGR